MRGTQVQSGMLREPLRAVLQDSHVQMKEVVRSFLQVHNITGTVR